MAARAALGRALLASGTTIVGLGAATMLVSSVSMGIAKVVVTENKVSQGLEATAPACMINTFAAALQATYWSLGEEHRDPGLHSQRAF
jgi:hypothetical protein